MLRRGRLIVGLALVGVLAPFVFPGASSALIEPFVVTLTASGPSPAVLTMPAGYPLVFRNTDTATHAVAFADGSCSVDVAPSSDAPCAGSFYPYVGSYDYTVDGTTQAQIVVTAIARSVSLRARKHSIRRGTWLTLHGQLHDIQFGSPPNAGSAQRIIVIARPYAGHPFHRAAVVMAMLHHPPRAPLGELVWHARIHPRAGMTYVAIASYQPPGGRIWERAKSKPFRVDVHR
jgi:hypothetical protein